MSLISFIATDKFISFMSDGRVFDSEKDEVLSENYKKITKVNDKIIFGIAGTFSASRVLNENLNLFDQQNAKSFADSMFSILIKDTVEKVKVPMHVLIGGLDEQGKIYYTGFSQDSTELIEIIPKFGNIYHACNENSLSVEITNHKRLGNLIQQNVFQAMKLKGAKATQEKLNAQVSMVDRSVNTKTFHEYIKR